MTAEHVQFVISSAVRNLIHTFSWAHFIIESSAYMPKSYYVYLLTNQNDKVMYVGMTNNLAHRIYEHRHHLIAGFTSKYYVNKLVYFEETADVLAAITREKQVKKWRREKKNALVEAMNPEWSDLSLQWT